MSWKDFQHKKQNTLTRQAEKTDQIHFLAWRIHNTTQHTHTHHTHTLIPVCSQHRMVESWVKNSSFDGLLEFLQTFMCVRAYAGKERKNIHLSSGLFFVAKFVWDKRTRLTQLTRSAKLVPDLGTHQFKCTYNLSARRHIFTSTANVNFDQNLSWNVFFHEASNSRSRPGVLDGSGAQ